MKNIDKILNDAKQQNTPEFPFSNEEIRNFISDADKGDIPNKPKNRGIIKMTIVSSAITAIITIFMLLNNSNETTIPTIAKVESIKSAVENVQDAIANPINSAISSSNNIAQKANSSMNKIIAQDNNEDELNNTADNNTPNSGIQNNSETSANNDQVTNNETPNTNEPKQETPDLAQASPKPNQEVEKPLPSPVIPKGDIRIIMPEIDSKYLDSLEVLLLSDDELANINVMKIPCGYTFQAEELFPKSSSKINSKKNREAAGYPDKGIVRSLHTIGKEIEEVELVQYTNWDMEKTLGIYPFSAWYDAKVGHLLSYSATSFGFTPLDDDMKAFVNEKSDYRRALRDSIEFNYQNNLNLISSIKIFYDKDKYETFKSIIPVLTKVKTDSIDAISTLFYPASTNIIKLLPKRYNLKADDEAFEYLTVGGDIDKVKNEFLSALNSSVNICKIAEPKKEIKPAAPIAGIEELILTAEEAKEIGIIYNNDGIEYISSQTIPTSEFPDIKNKELYENLGYNFSQDSIKFNTAYKFNKNGIRESEMMLGGYSILSADYIINDNIKGNMLVQRTSKISYISNDLSLKDNILDSNSLYNSKPKYSNYTLHELRLNESMLAQIGLTLNNSDEFYSKDSLGNFRPVISNVLPVKLELNGEILETHIPVQSTHYLWFYIDKNFAMKLPERYRTPILRELEIMEQVKRGELQPEMACEALKGEKSYLGVCTANNPEIKNLKVYPNPVIDKTINVKFKLDKKTKLTIALYKPDGEFVENLNDINKEYNADNYTLIFKNPNLENGVYMLSIADDNGNRAIRKIIVQN